MRIRWCILPTLMIVGLMGFAMTIVCKAAAGPDFNQKGSITILMKDEETNSAVPGGEVCLYYVAEIQEKSLEYSYTGEFTQCGLSLKDLEDGMLPKDLWEFAEKQKITGVQKEIDENGTVVYEDLALGLYLVVQTKAAEGYYAINPFLITVPVLEKAQWVYDVSSQPKMEPLSGSGSPAGSPDLGPLPVPAPKPVPQPGPILQLNPLIPKTGQLWWPVPVLAFAGSVCILIGLMFGKWDAKNAE